MDNPIAVCVDRNPFSSLDELVAMVGQAGFAAVEWFEMAEDDPWSNARTAKHLRGLMRRHELRAQYHAPYEGIFDLGREGESARRPDSVAGVISQFLDKAERLGARLTTVHLGTCPPGADRTEALKNVMEGIVLAVPELERRGARIALENHTPAIIKAPLGDHPEDFDWLMENIASPWVGRTLDIGHAHIDDHVVEFLARPFDRIFNVHLHDNEGEEDQHLPLGAGTVSWDTVLSRIGKECYHGPFTLEFFAAPAEYLNAIRMVRECK